MKEFSFLIKNKEVYKAILEILKGERKMSMERIKDLENNADLNKDEILRLQRKIEDFSAVIYVHAELVEKINKMHYAFLNELRLHKTHREVYDFLPKIEGMYYDVEKDWDENEHYFRN